jgi:hypothetical protein
VAERKGFVRVDSSEVQGEGSFALVRKLSYEQKRMATRMVAKANKGVLPSNVDAMSGMEVGTEFLDDNDEFTRSLLVENVLQWNWVDFDGKPLPLPKDDPDVIARLTDEEVEFLAKTINGQRGAAEIKN